MTSSELNNTGVHPVGEYVLIRRDRPVFWSGHLHLPDNPAAWPWTGRVLEVGDRVNDPDVAPGARVLFEPKGSSALVPDTREGGPQEWERVIRLPLGNVLAVIDEE